MGSAPTVSQAHAGHLAQVFAQYPIEVAHGDGVWLHARDGRKILDFYGGHAVAGLGYAHPRWLAALERQARQMSFQTNALPMVIRERAAARLLSPSPPALLARSEPEARPNNGGRRPSIVSAVESQVLTSN